MSSGELRGADADERGGAIGTRRDYWKRKSVRKRLSSLSIRKA